ncbi:hypothetical protein LINGRAPRIM_LOCUS1974 [Linum grandiflorum]
MDVTTSPLLAQKDIDHQFPHKTATSSAPDLGDDYYSDDEADTLSLRDLPLHNYDHHDHRSISPVHHQVEDLFEFSTDFLIKSNTDQAAINTNGSTNNVVLFGKLISKKNEDDNTTTTTSSVNHNKKKQSRVSRWKSFSLSSSSASSSSSSSSLSSSCCSSRNEVVLKKEKKKGRSNGKGYMCLAIGVEWKFPVKSMDIQDIKVRQSRMNRRTSFDYTPSDSSVATKPSAKGLWSLLGVLAGGGRPY